MQIEHLHIHMENISTKYRMITLGGWFYSFIKSLTKKKISFAACKTETIQHLLTLFHSHVFPNNWLNLSFPLPTCGNSFLSKVAIYTNSMVLLQRLHRLNQLLIFYQSVKLSWALQLLEYPCVSQWGSVMRGGRLASAFGDPACFSKHGGIFTHQPEEKTFLAHPGEEVMGRTTGEEGKY